MEKGFGRVLGHNHFVRRLKEDEERTGRWRYYHPRFVQRQYWQRIVRQSRYDHCKRRYRPVWTPAKFFRRVERGETTLRDAEEIRRFVQRLKACKVPEWAGWGFMTSLQVRQSK